MITRVSQGLRHATFRIGEVSVTALSDGHVDMPISRLRSFKNTCPDDAILAVAETIGGALRLPVTAFAIQRGTQTIFFDLGAANAWHPTMGFLEEAMAEAGISPNAINAIALTHTHVDHIHGSVHPGGSLRFPMTTKIHVPANELALYRQEQRLAPTFDLLTALNPGDTLAEGITVEEAYGHEIGHSNYRIQCGEYQLIIWGDIVHVPSIQFRYPDVTWEYDTDQDMARSTRRRILRACADQPVVVAGAHLAFPGLGFVKSAGRDGFRFEALH